MTNEELCTRLQNGEMDISAIIVEQNIGFLLSTARAYARKLPIRLVDADDFLQEGSLALLRAARSYSAQRKCCFLTYAAVAVRNAITDAIRKTYPALQIVDEESAVDVSSVSKEYSLSSLNSYQNNPEQILIQREETVAVHTAMENIPLRENVWVRQRFGLMMNLAP